MVEVSPSTKKVDDFLSSLSQLSQERLREDQRRQRGLQRNIDELRERLGSSSPMKSSSIGINRSSSSLGHYHDEVPQLRFNRDMTSRDKFYQDLKDLEASESPPPKPKRPSGSVFDTTHDDSAQEDPPSLPTRPEYRFSSSRSSSPPPPALPKRRDLDSKPHIQIGLATPVARSSSGSYRKPHPPKPSHLRSNGNNDSFESGDHDVTTVVTPSTNRHGTSDYNEAKSDILQSSPNEAYHRSNSGKGKVNTVIDPSTGAPRISFIDAREKPNSESQPKTPKSFNKTSTQIATPGRSSSSAEKQHNSFTEMENNIRDGKDVNNSARKLFNQQSTPSPEAETERNNKSYKPIKPSKSNWLSSTLQNSNTTEDGLHIPRPSFYNAISASQAAKSSPAYINRSPSKLLDVPDDTHDHQNTFTRSPSIRVGQTPRSWIDSVVSHEDHLDPDDYLGKPNFTIPHKTDNSLLFHEEEHSIHVPKNSSPSREKNPHSWIDSMAKRVGSTLDDNYDKPSFVIPKKDKTSLDLYKPKEEPKQPDYLSHLAKFKKDGKKPAPIPPKRKDKSLTPEEEELLKLREEKLSGKSDKHPPATPKPKPPLFKYDKDQDILKNQLGRLSPTKSPGFSQRKDFESKDQELLRNQLGKLSPTKSPGFNQKRDYESKDQELLKSQMNKLHANKPKETPTLHKYEEKDSEVLRSQLQKLGAKHTRTVSWEKPKEDQGPEGLKALAKLKPAKAPPPKPADLPEALKQLEALKSGKRSVSPVKSAQLEDRDKIDTSDPPDMEKEDEPTTKAPVEETLNKDQNLDEQKATKSAPSKPPKKRTEAKTVEEEKDQKQESKPAPPKPAPLRKASTDIEPSTQDENESKADLTKSSFQNQLSSILRASTAPVSTNGSGLGAKTTPGPSIKTEKKKDSTGPTKLTHPNKGRAKGPKRRLPRNMQSLATDKKDGPSEKIPDFKNKKIPPRINKTTKPKPEDIKPSRVLSGEVFI
ncbi:hypothetical protein HYPBUDRAFT_152003 [Hyphopichia burtonii NRRL Y-1933]|uniref:Uncharacterized protein n=1 Tax=Hyphopichia burtonii NRRL Y-1933 TaxID=984485 RepID=A0A1E4RN26_9ASCO|nr:hypothetical protein HYPBUDRAFT_152003 [Hyphopichia burtonii NRRL Y-1933]ODV68591.1 hypothetical protein HYPBUDRAFT_152003 [Hyphopichia burtonii NRRL Y-1933]